MSAPAKSVRFPPALLALIAAECDRTGKSFSDVVIDACADQLAEHRPEPATRAPEPAPKITRARAALAQAEARTGAAKPRLDTSAVPVYDGKKRPAYQKGQAGQGKAGRGGRGR